MFFNSEGWPVIAPYRYIGETIENYQDDIIYGSYKMINHGRDISPEMKLSEIINLEKNGKISGAVNGTWERTGKNGIILTIDNKKYDGILLKQWDEDGKKEVMTFSAVCSENGTAIWGSGLNAIEN